MNPYGDPIITFGKYIGRRQSELLADDTYVRWLAQSSWVKFDQPDLYRKVRRAARRPHPINTLRGDLRRT